MQTNLTNIRLDEDVYQYIRLGHTSSRRLQDIFKEPCLQEFFKTHHQVKLFAQVTLLRNLFSMQKTCKHDKDFSSFSITPWFQFFTLLHLLVAVYRPFSEPGQTSACEMFLRKQLIVSGFQLFSKKKFRHRCSTGLKIGAWLRV